MWFIIERTIYNSIGMYAANYQIRQLVVLLRSHGVQHAVLCPGSRNAPLVQTLTSCKDFTCYSIVDERSAGFFALGLSLAQGGVPTAVVCTSGSALLNLAPSVAEAFYQGLPLIVISADRPEAWIGQKDGQTLPQAQVFGSLVRKAINLPLCSGTEDTINSSNEKERNWFSNRLINEALLAATQKGKGPVHINVPIAEPLFDFSAKELPTNERVIQQFAPLRVSPEKITPLQHAEKVMIVMGQMQPSASLQKALQELSSHGCVVVTEQLGNFQEADETFHPDWNLTFQYAQLADEETSKTLQPDVVLYCGGHIVAKQLKSYLRSERCETTTFVQLNPSSELTDTFTRATYIVEAEVDDFLTQWGTSLKENASTKGTEKGTVGKAFAAAWKALTKRAHEALKAMTYNHASSLYHVKQYLETLPKAGCAVHLANSNTVRLAELATAPKGTRFYCNRGINGIEGSLSMAAGFAAIEPGETHLIIGDLSFHYDCNILYHRVLFPRLKILVLDNAGGGIFRTLRGLQNASGLNYIAATPPQEALSIASNDPGITHLVFDSEVDTEAYLTYYKLFQ